MKARNFYLFRDTKVKFTYLEQEMKYSQRPWVSFGLRDFVFSSMNYLTVFGDFLLFSVHAVHDRGFQVPEEVRAQSAFFSSKRTVPLAFLREQLLMSHSFLQCLEFPATLETTKAPQTQDSDDNPTQGLAEGRTAMAIPWILASFAATWPFPGVFFKCETLIMA